MHEYFDTILEISRDTRVFVRPFLPALGAAAGDGAFVLDRCTDHAKKVERGKGEGGGDHERK